jgi:DNA-binding PucR family transcriptional regulator
VDDPALARLKLFEVVRRAVRSCSPGSVAVMHSECMVILIPASEDGPEAQNARALAEVLRHEIHWAYPTVTASVAIGGPCVGLVDFGRRHAEARRALDALSSLNTRDQTVTLDDLGIYGILFRRGDPDELLGFAHRVLDPLIEYDRRNRTSLLETLRVYLDENGSFRGTARRLSVHLNTLRGRLERVSHLCRVELRDARVRLNFQVALQIHGLGQADPAARRLAAPMRGSGGGHAGGVAEPANHLPLPRRARGSG